MTDPGPTETDQPTRRAVSDVLLCETADAVATVTLNRPDAMNALDTALKERLRDTLREVAEDPAVRASRRCRCVGGRRWPRRRSCRW